METPPGPASSWSAGRGPWAGRIAPQANAFAGTPVIVRASDGAVLHGYRNADALRAFARVAKDTHK